MDQKDMLALVERGMCPFCGNGPYGIVGSHVAKMHGVRAHALRELLGVSNSYIFATAETRAKMSASYDKERGARIREARKNGKVYAPPRRTTAGRQKNIKAIVEYNVIAAQIRKQLD